MHLKDAERIGIDDQIKCIDRELALRRAAYPRWIASGRIRPSEADYQLAAMEAVKATLEDLKAVAIASRANRKMTLIEEGDE